MQAAATICGIKAILLKRRVFAAMALAMQSNASRMSVVRGCFEGRVDELERRAAIQYRRHSE